MSGFSTCHSGLTHKNAVPFGPKSHLCMFP